MFPRALQRAGFVRALSTSLSPSAAPPSPLRHVRRLEILFVYFPFNITINFESLVALGGERKPSPLQPSPLLASSVEGRDIESF